MLLAGFFETADKVIAIALSSVCVRLPAVCEIALVLRSVPDGTDVDEDDHAVTRVMFGTLPVKEPALLVLVPFIVAFGNAKPVGKNMETAFRIASVGDTVGGS